MADLTMEEYLPHEEAEFIAYLDIQLEEEILIPHQEDILETFKN